MRWSSYSYANDSIRYMERGQKRYELSNHTSTKLSTGLGNVLAVPLAPIPIVGDRRLQSCDADELAYYEAEVVSVSVPIMSGYPFGMLPKTTNLRFGSFSSAAMAVEIKERSWSVSAYRYGFNGMERDDEVKGSGNSYDFEARIYDSRIGRFLVTDPMEAQYSGISSYHFGANCPIAMRDSDGKDGIRNGANATITATIVFIYDPDQISAQQAGDFAVSAESNITQVWNSNTHNGINITTNLDVQVMTIEAYNLAVEAGTINPTNGQTNTITLSNSGRSHVNGDMRTGTWNINNLDNNVPAHEFGHLLGLDDRYQYVQAAGGAFGIEYQWLEVYMPQDQANDNQYNPYDNLYSSGSSTLTGNQTSFVFGNSNGISENLEQYTFFGLPRTQLPYKGAAGLSGGGFVLGLDNQGNLTTDNENLRLETLQYRLPSSLINSLDETNYKEKLSGNKGGIGDYIIKHQESRSKYSSGSNTINNLQAPYE
jgi:RHS repeat-associated protein